MLPGGETGGGAGERRGPGQVRKVAAGGEKKAGEVGKLVRCRTKRGKGKGKGKEEETRDKKEMEGGKLRQTERI